MTPTRPSMIGAYSVYLLSYAATRASQPLPVVWEMDEAAGQALGVADGCDGRGVATRADITARVARLTQAPTDATLPAHTITG